VPRGKGPVLTVVITAATEGLDKGLKEAEKKLGIFGKSKGKLAGIAKVAAPIAGVAAVAAKLGKSAADVALATESWASAMDKLGVANATTNPTIQAAIQGSKDLAFGAADTRAGLLALTTATGSAEQALALLPAAQDIARLSGEDLATVSEAIAKAYNGQDRALRALVPGLASGATGMETIANATAIAAGQADIYAESASGMADKTKMALKGLAVTIGKAVQPAFEGMLAVLLPIITSLGELVTAILPILIPLIQAVAKAFEIAAKAISKVVSLVASLITKIRELLGPLTSAVNKLQELNPFKGKVGQIITAGTPSGITVGGFATAAPVAGAGGGGVTINIYGDPAVIEARVTRALRDYARRNGAAAVFTPGRA
jgi:hypothetical protein